MLPAREGVVGVVVRIFICIFFAGLALSLNIDDLNEVTELRRQIPTLEKQLRRVNEENARLQYEIDRFESPVHLMALMRQPEFRYLRHPELKDIIQLQHGELVEATND